MADQFVALDVHTFVGEELQLGLGSLAIVQPEVVAGLEVHTNGAFRVRLQVHRKDLQRHVVVVQLVVAHGHVHVEREVVTVLQQQPLVNVRCLMKRSEKR